jgi:ribose/xylose/arabinose/galactoside ABC-type transport system permease subunit
MIMMGDGIQHIGKMLLLIGIIVAAIGGLLIIAGRISWFGRLPGDILIQKKNFTFYFPLATSVLISIVLTLLFWLLGRR